MELNYQDIFHTGLSVSDLPGAIRFYELALGVKFTAPQRLEHFQIWSPEKSLETIELTFAFSIEGPQHIEIQYGTPGSFWDPTLYRGDHVGLWVDDVAQEVRAMLDKGWRVKVCGAPPEAGYGAFAYMEPITPGGIVVELVPRDVKPAFERWWATGVFQL